VTLQDEEYREEPFALTPLQVFGGCFDIMTQTLPLHKQVNVCPPSPTRPGYTGVA